MSVSIIISRRKIDSNPQALYNMGNYMGNTGGCGFESVLLRKNMSLTKMTDERIYITSYRHRKNKLGGCMCVCVGGTYPRPPRNLPRFTQSLFPAS